MGFPAGYTELLLLPKLLIHALSLLSIFRRTIITLFRHLGIPADFLEPNSSAAVDSNSSAEILPVVKFADLVDPPESCAVCLYDFEEEDEIRNLANCRHVFHKDCLDRWMGYDRRTCPMCRTAVIPEDMQESFNDKFWAASGIPDFYGEFSQISR
ncbi:Brassinosteroid-responsive RING protein 1 [Linum grandiflorum]